MQDPQSPVPRLLFWSGLGRAIWVLVFLVAFTTFVASLPYYYATVTTICQNEPCHDTQPTPTEADMLRQLGLSLAWRGNYYLALMSIIALVYGLFALFLIWRRPNEPVVWQVSLILALFGTFSTPSVDALIPLSTFWAYLVGTLNSLVWVGFALLCYVFPDGRFVPGWTRWAFAGWLLYTATLYTPATSPLRSDNWPAPLQGMVILGLLATGLIAQVYRYRRVSHPVQRQQTKWVAGGLSVLVLMLAATNSLPDVNTVEAPAARIAYTLTRDSITLVSMLALPVLFTISILRYRLWDIDLLIRRTVIYTLLTGTLALLYFGSVLLLQRVLADLLAESNQLAVVASTLLIAALFAPLRHWMQRGIDRRFYRRKYNMEQTLAAFSATVRNETDLHELGNHLVAIAQETMQPEQVVIWLRKSR
jgi:hypothetical protein